MRVGIGRDSHKLAEGRRLVIGGVEIDSPRGAVAHSDGDALLHAVIDAMLGAAALGDIGDLFPDTDPQYEDADSRGLLKQANALVQEKGYRVGNVDATVLLESPKLGPMKQAMRENIAADLGLGPERVNVKAKSAEGLGEVGRGEAVAAEAVVVVEPV
ncbi:MAG: 2-C-methyl-D-erythritol 2,4-cyclodiphosphate synthase [Planctomycetota bacterium]